MLMSRIEPAQARSAAPLRFRPRCGTVQDPPRAAVLPARGGIGPDKRSAWADPGNLSIHIPGQRRRSHRAGRDGRWCASPKGPPPKFGESGGQVGRPALIAGHRQLTHLERSGR